MSNMVVRTNIMSLNSHRNLGMTGAGQAKAAARLSSGFRINSAADDAAGLAISEKMRAQIRGLDQASRNAQDGISLIQTAEGAMNTVNDMVVRIRELVIQAANDTNAHDPKDWVNSDRVQIQREINQLFEEIDAVTLRTEFNTRTLLDGSLSAAGQPILTDTQRIFINDFLLRNATEVTAFNNAENNVDVSNAHLANLRAEQEFLQNLKDQIEEQTGLGASANITLTTATAATNDSVLAQVLLGLHQAWADHLDRNPGSETGQVAEIKFVVEQINQALGLTGAFALTADDLNTPVAATGMISFEASFGISDIAGFYTDPSDSTTWQAGSGFSAANVDVIRDRLAAVAAQENGNWGAGRGQWGAGAHSVTATTLPAATNNSNNVKLFAPDGTNLTNNTIVAGQAMGAGAWALFFDAGTGRLDALDAQIATQRGNVTTANNNLTGINNVLNANLRRDDNLNRDFNTYREMMAAFNYKGTDGSLWFHIGANVGQGINLSIEAVNVAKLHEMAAKHTKTEEGFNIEELRTSDVTEANSEKGVMRVRGEDINKFVAALDASLAHVVGQRAHLGAVQNRLEYTIENLDIASENLSASNSRIKDADMAKEMMRFTQFNVLQQAAISMLAQANQAPQNILQLLR